MSEPPSAAESPPASSPRRSFWQRRLIDPILRQLTQGVTPAKVSFTLALSIVCSLFPLLGFTWLVNLVVGIPLRLNQPIMQTLNQILTPVHLVMIVVYVRWGEWIWQAPGQPFSVTDMLKSFSELSVGEFLQQFGWAGIHATSAWLLTAPLLFALCYLPLRPLINRLARLRLGVH